MNITEITKKAGAKKPRRRVGRGDGSGQGGTAGRGHKGAGQRSGYRRTVLAEGGMFPFFRRIPKYGFNNAQFRTEYQIVNVDDLGQRFDSDAHVTAAALEEAGLIRDRAGLVKVLGDGELSMKLTVEAHRFSSSAVSKIETAGGTAKWLAPKPKKKFVKRPKVAEPEPEPKPKPKSSGKGKKASKPDKQAEAASEPKGDGGKPGKKSPPAADKGRDKKKDDSQPEG